MVGLLVFIALNRAEGLPLLADPDTQWHVTVGQWILAHATVPTTDSYSFTATGQPWIAKEWLAQVMFGMAYNLGGWGGVTALGAVGLAGTAALMLRLLLRDLRPLPALLFVTMALVMTGPHFLARPFVLAFPFLLLWTVGLVRAVEERRAPSPWLLLCMLLWANLHGGFTFGLLLAGAFALDALVGAGDWPCTWAERRALFFAWAKFGIAALLVSCITPYGPEAMVVTQRIFDLGSSLSLIVEWQAPNFQNQAMQEVIILLGLYLALSRGLKLPLVRLLIVLGLMHMFLRYSRNAELLALLAPLVIAPLLARQFPSVAAAGPAAAGSAVMGFLERLARPAGRAAVLLFVAIGALAATYMIRLGTIAPPAENAPTAALAFAREQGFAERRVFNSYGYGGYLIHAGIPTFIDGRAELFGGAFLRRYADAVALKGDALQKVLEATASTGRCAHQPGGQPTAGLPAGLAAGLSRRHRDDLRARALRLRARALRLRARALRARSALEDNPRAGAQRAEPAAPYRGRCPNRACGRPRRSSSRPRRSVRRREAGPAPWRSCGRSAPCAGRRCPGRRWRRGNRACPTRTPAGCGRRHRHGWRAGNRRTATCRAGGPAWRTRASHRRRGGRGHTPGRC